MFLQGKRRRTAIPSLKQVFGKCPTVWNQCHTTELLCAVQPDVFFCCDMMLSRKLTWYEHEVIFCV